MANSLVPLQQPCDIELSKEPLECFPFIVKFVYGTLYLVSSSISGFINFTFNLFCSFVFRSFRLVDCVLQMLETLLEFSKTLLQFNYILVSRGLTVLGQFASKSSASIQILLASVYKFLICSYVQLVNLPFVCFETAVYLLEEFEGFSLTLSKQIVDFLNTISVIIWSCFHAILTRVSQYCLGIVLALQHNFAHLTAGTISWLADILHVVQKQTLLFATETISGVLGIIRERTSIVFARMFAYLNNINSYLTSSGQNFFALISESIKQVGIIFEQLGEWISMPFTFTNLKAILASAILLLKNISHIFVLTLSFTFELVKSCLFVAIELIVDSIHCVMKLKQGFPNVPFWVVIVTVIFLAIFILYRHTHVLKNLMILIQNACRLLSPIRQRNVIQQDQMRLNQETELQGEEMVVRDDRHGHMERNDEKPNAVKSEGNSMTLTRESLKEEDELTICIICQDVQRSTVLLPCRHLCLCRHCAESLHTNIDRHKRICPLCREHIYDIMDVYI